MDLINLSDGGNSVRLRILGRHRPGILPVHDLMDAEMIVGSEFINGSFRVHFFLRDLKAWSSALDSLENGQNAEWLDTGNGPTIRIECAESDHHDTTVFIEDTSGSYATAILPIALNPGWIQEQRTLLVEGMKTWPMEVVETSPGCYEWKR
ncbi:DUF5959 family protein [Streptomyces sp. NPDC002787]